MPQKNIEMITIPKKLFRDLIETIELLADKEEIKDIVSGIRDIKEGRVYTEEEFLKMSSKLDGE